MKANGTVKKCSPVDSMKMKVWNDLKTYRPQEKAANVALGFFDGVHLGHRAVIGACAKDPDAVCIVLTFRESPAKVLGRSAPPLISDNARKAQLLAQAGAHEVIFADFAAVKDLSPEEFVRDILCAKLHAKRVFCGFNYRFGQGGKGDVALLKTLCTEIGIGVTTVSAVYCDGEQVSSSLIRRCIADGEIARANRMLGYRYAVEGVIEGGNQFGSSMGFPTVNIPIREGAVIPRFGVYASQVTIDGAVFRGATNIGVHPTVGANDEPLCESFLLDFDGGDLYGKKAACTLIEFIRPERRFSSKEELTAQIRLDCDTIGKMDL